MPRCRRIFVPGVSVHLFQRGHNRAAVFADATDREWFLALLENAAADKGLDVHGYTLMTNHYHLLGTPSSERSVSRAIHQCGSRYVRYYNARHARSGTLWGGRFKAVVIREERHWLTCLRYIEQNPVRAHLVDAAEQYQWSSYRVHAEGAPHDWLISHPVYESLGVTSRERQHAYQELCGTPLSDEDLTIPRFAK
jgi:putative transposase